MKTQEFTSRQRHNQTEENKGKQKETEKRRLLSPSVSFCLLLSPGVSLCLLPCPSVSFCRLLSLLSPSVSLCLLLSPSVCFRHLLSPSVSFCPPSMFCTRTLRTETLSSNCKHMLSRFVFQQFILIIIRNYMLWISFQRRCSIPIVLYACKWMLISEI